MTTPAAAAAPAPAPAPAPLPAQGTAPGANSTRSSRYNHRRNNNSNGNSGTSNSRTKFVPKIESIEALATSSEIRSQDFSKFQKSIHHHVLTTFKHSKDLSTAILEFTDPLVMLQQNRPSLASIRAEHDLRLIPTPTVESTDEKERRDSDNQDQKDMLKNIFNNDIKSLSERQRDPT